MKLDDKITDYHKEFAKAKVITVIICVVCMLCSIFIIKSGIDEAEESRNTIFVADANNTLLLALSNDMKTNLPNEAKATLKRMHHYMFNMTPSATHINESIRRAEMLGDGSVVQYVEKTKEKGWYNKMIAEGISTEFLCDSIRLETSDNENYQYKAVLYGKTSMIHPDRIEFRELITDCYLRFTSRTLENPNGFTVFLWKIDKEEVIKVLTRDTEKMTVQIAEQDETQDSTSTKEVEK